MQRLRALHKDLQASFECISSDYVYIRILNKAHANNYLAMWQWSPDGLLVEQGPTIHYCAVVYKTHPNFV